MIAKFKKIERAYERSVQFERWRNRTLPKIESHTTQKERPKSMIVYLRRSVILLFIPVLFLPYTYEPGGNFILLPNQQQNISAENSGIIENINYDGGEMLKKGTVIGQLSYSDYEAQVKIYDARIKQQQAVINELKAKPRPEELKLAKSALKTNKTQAEFSRAKAFRYEKLYNEGVISFEDLDDAQREFQVDLDQVQEKTANLELVKSGASPDEIAEAEAKLQSYQEEHDHYQEKIEQSILYMPFDGKLITLHLKQRIGSYLNRGEPLAAAEQTNQVKAEIEIPETDIRYFKENSKIRFRFHVYHDESFYGVVKTIDANVQDENHAKVVKVVALLENKNERLKSGMTGYAKISSEKMPIWKVFSLAILRFIKVEVWSWFP
jgi:putative peptide zinc metalloprotease protein